MLKPLLLSGWFRVQPFLNYFVLVMLIAPLVAASAHSSSAKQSKVVSKVATETEESDALPQEIATVRESDLVEVLITPQKNSSTRELETLPQETVVALPTDNFESLLAKEYIRSDSDIPVNDSLAAVELAPLPKTPDSQLSAYKKINEVDLYSIKENSNIIQRETLDENLLAATQAMPTLRESQPDAAEDVPIVEQPEQAATGENDPIGSPHPIPWKWIVSTQQAIGSQGNSRVRYYRSLPVVSPDGKYAVYSRVELEIKPEMYNSKVNSVLFVEERATKKLRIMAATTTVKDPLLSRQEKLAAQSPRDGKIGVLVPVSWSEKSDRFLARKFEGVFNTGDSTDQAVIWDREKNQTNTVAPAQNEDEHEKIAVLLGWSKNEPDHVLFRAGEMGEENWPLVKVAVDGKTGATTDADQPVTYGDKATEIWSGPQVASR
ncbi:hypothetical protein Nos7524_0305 [Nostoc sp. PCC 7524]|uniref:hypothetical protein n=1 Tax=Nostoc sp. (strain ATCC 29411 / PCC 7524) TaxID=28072 RepID=UPI00029EDED7|nr:hypothetical protein [Nostoc sp. PCC 7524]AFY46226.1 hypothetical protein Nos7524_0305 [Nostoc sp. PCC 7524]